MALKDTTTAQMPILRGRVWMIPGSPHEIVAAVFWTRRCRGNRANQDRVRCSCGGDGVLSPSPPHCLHSTGHPVKNRHISTPRRPFRMKERGTLSLGPLKL